MKWLVFVKSLVNPVLAVSLPSGYPMRQSTTVTCCYVQAQATFDPRSTALNDDG